MAAELSNPKWRPLLALLLLAGMCRITVAGNMAMYWGLNGDEGTLVDACNSGVHSFVILSPLGKDLSGRSGIGCPGNCTGLNSGIKACQSLDVKVLLAHGEGNSTAADDDDDAQSVANYLWGNFLGGSSPSRQLGDTVLDGINFDTETGNAARYEELADSLSQLSGDGACQGPKLYLTAAPQMPFPGALQVATLGGVQGPLLRNLENGALYIYHQTANYAKQHDDPALLGTRLEKGY